MANEEDERKSLMDANTYNITETASNSVINEVEKSDELVPVDQDMTNDIVSDSSVSYQNPTQTIAAPLIDSSMIAQNYGMQAEVIANLEPRSRTNSERFHCHIGGDESDENLSGAGGGTTSPANRKAIRILWISVIVCLFFMICEVFGGVWAQSLAIITDAAHLLTDLASMLISLFSLYLASRPASQRMSFGWHRAEVVGAFVSVFLIWVVTGILVYLAIDRIITQVYDIDAKIMAITAGIGVLVNIIMGGLLYFGGHSHSHLGGGKHSHSHLLPNTKPLGSNAGEYEQLLGLQEVKKKHSTNINVRAAFIHVLGDLIQSVGVLIAALLILWKKELAIMDPICTLLFSVIVISTTVYIIREALVVLLEGRPSNIDFSHVFQALEKSEGVRKVHDLRIWALTTDKVAISVHLEIETNAHAQTILKNTTLMLRRDFNVHESTVQIEGWSPDSINCYQCIVPQH